MSTAEIKQKLQQYIETGDEKLLKLMYAIAREYNDDEKEYELNDAEMQMLEERWEIIKVAKAKAIPGRKQKLLLPARKNRDNV
ncbi:MAG: hypothetical protein WDO71_18240 [Bacteroidota bacterium]